MAVFNFNGIILQSLDSVNSGEVFSLLSVEAEYRQVFTQLIKSSVEIAERTSKSGSIEYEVRTEGEGYALAFNWPAARFNCWLTGIYLDYIKRNQRPQGLTPSWADSVLDNFQFLVNASESVEFSHQKKEKKRIATLKIATNKASLFRENQRAKAGLTAENSAPISIEQISELLLSNNEAAVNTLEPQLRDLFLLLKPLNNKQLIYNYLRAAQCQRIENKPIRAFAYYHSALDNFGDNYTSVPVPLLENMADLEYSFLSSYNSGIRRETETFRIENNHFLHAAFQIITEHRNDLKHIALSYARMSEAVLPALTNPDVIKHTHFVISFAYLWNRRLEDAAKLHSKFLSDSVWCHSMDVSVKTYIACALALDNTAFAKDLLNSHPQLRLQFPVLIECWEAPPDKPFDNSRIAEYSEAMNYIHKVKLVYRL